MPKKPTNKEKIDQFKGYARYSSMGFQMIVIIGGSVWGGYWLDRLVDLKFPVFIVLGSLFGVVIAIYFAIKDV